MAVLGDRATNVLDMIIEGFRNEGQPMQAGSPMQSPMVADVRMPSPTQSAMSQAMGQFRMQDQPLPLDRGGIYERRTPYVPTGTQMDTPVAPARMTPTPVQPIVPVNQLIEGREMQPGQGVMQPGVDRETMLRAGKVAKDALDTGDESIISRVQGFFGGRENMLRLAMAFNTMRLQPDAQLTQVLGSELQQLQKGRATNKTQTEIINWLQTNGYGEYVGIAMQNPKAAMEIFKQITQREFAPGKGETVSGVQYDADQKAYVVKTKDGETTVEYIGTQRADPIESKRLEGQWNLSAKRSDEISQKANGLETQLRLYNDALGQLDAGAETGLVRSQLPAFDKATATLRSIAQQLGISVINSATFGALSEKELQLALDTNMNLSLDPTELRLQIIEKIEATQKLYLEMRKKAAEMASMPYDEYIKMKNQQEQENAKYMTRPEGVPAETWFGMNLQQRKDFIEAGND